MAVQRVSPTPDPPPGYTVKDGYLWTMQDPPCVDPVTVHHDAVVEHHDAVKETRWFVSATVEFTRRAGGAVTTGLTADLGEADAGTSKPSSYGYETSLSGQTSTGVSVTARYSRSAWSVSFPSDGPTYYYVGGTLPEGTGSYQFSGGGDPSYGGTLSVTVESREVEVSPEWDESVSDSWDEVVFPAALRRISYLGDY